MYSATRNLLYTSKDLLLGCFLLEICWVGVLWKRSRKNHCRAKTIVNEENVERGHVQLTTPGGHQGVQVELSLVSRFRGKFFFEEKKK